MGLGIALISASHPHSLSYLETLLAMEAVDRIYLWDKDPGNLGKVCEEKSPKIIRKTTMIEELLDDRKIDAAIIALPPKLLPGVAKQFLRAGKGVLVEKPGARNADELVSTVRIAEEKNLIFSVCYPTRCSPVAEYVRKVIKEGLLGKIVSFEARWIASQVRFRNPELWLFDKEMAGGGILHWLGCHWLDLLRYWLDAEVRDVSCFTATSSGEVITVEDTAALVLRFANGSVGTLRYGYHLIEGKRGYVGGSYDTYLNVAGTDGYIRWIPRGEGSDSLVIRSIHLDSSGAGYKKKVFAAEKMPGYGGRDGWLFIDRFLESLKGERIPAITGQDAIQVLRVIDGAYESAETGKTVQIQY